jgi:predicted O-methyltransferase YrrM
LLPWRRGRFEFELHQGYTRDTLPAFRKANPNFTADFVFIDGGHKIETIDEDWRNCSRLVDRRGVIYLDDYYGNAELAKQFGCNVLVDRLTNDPAWDVTVLPVTDTFERIGSVQIARVAPA